MRNRFNFEAFALFLGINFLVFLAVLGSTALVLATGLWMLPVVVFLIVLVGAIAVGFA